MMRYPVRGPKERFMIYHYFRMHFIHQEYPVRYAKCFRPTIEVLVFFLIHLIRFKNLPKDIAVQF